MSHPLPDADMQRIRRYGRSTAEYTVAIITDEDHASRIELEDGQIAWTSTLRRDRLIRHVDRKGRVHYEIEPLPAEQGGEQQLVSLIAEGGRGAEFSELAMFGRHLLTFDDRTGLVCEVRHGNRLVPRNILQAGCGDERFKGFKAEWATLQGNGLIVGSHGKTREEEWVKILDRAYNVTSQDWRERYQAIREALGVGEAGYVIHEAAEWHPLRRQWLFFPRKLCDGPFDEDRDQRECGGNRLVTASGDFSRIEVLNVGERHPERGMSSFKILPGHEDECIGLKSVEIGDERRSYLFCFNLEGEVLQEDIPIGNYKCEGLEIL